MSENHVWRFFRAGGFDQVRLDSGADLMALGELDQKLWVALACPTTRLGFDARTLALIDTDKDGRIRAPELIAAVKWAGSCLKNPDDLLKSAPQLPLDAIQDATDEGRQLLASAKRILASLGKEEAPAITAEDTTDTEKIFSRTRFNGDGVIQAGSADEEETRKIIEEIIACLGSEKDHSGEPGVNQARVDLFFSEARAYSDWRTQAETDPAILPLGDATFAAFASYRVLKAKIDDYFTRCRIAAFDPASQAALNPSEKEYLALSAREVTPALPDIAAMPLARIRTGGPLPLAEGLNPAWAGLVADLRARVVQPLFDKQDSLAEAEWLAIVAKFTPHDQWTGRKAGASVESLGLVRIREILAGRGREVISSLIDRDRALESEFRAIAQVEKLVRYHRDLYTLVNNFVSFRDFYGRKNKAIFQAGTLYLDQRSCDLCIAVENGVKHAAMAGLSGTYLAYCDCVRRGSGEQMQIVAAFTDGDSDSLFAGRNGIFYDSKGRDWDATITRLVDNPISIRQAFWAPYRKAARMIQNAIAKRAASSDQAATARLARRVDQMEQAATKGPEAATAAAEPAKKPVDPGMIAALGVGAAGLGGMLGGLVSGFLNLKGLMPFGVLAIMLLISGPSMVLAWLKLRKRSLGPILDANGWAMNARVRINVPFGASLTQVAALPPGAQRDLGDPFAEKRRPWGLYVALLLILLLALGWSLGKFDRILSAVSPNITSAWVLHGVPPPSGDPSAAKDKPQ